MRLSGDMEGEECGEFLEDGGYQILNVGNGPQWQDGKVKPMAM